MIKRVWHGWTTRANADTYQALLESQVFPGIEAKQISGYRGIELLRREGPDEVEFVTLMSFDSLADVVAFQGEDYERAYVPEAARAVLTRWDEVSRHYEVEEVRSYDTRSSAVANEDC